MEKPLNQRVLEEVEAFLATSGMSPTRFGSEAVGNRNLLPQLRRGANPRTDTVDAIRRYIRDHTERPSLAA